MTNIMEIIAKVEAEGKDVIITDESGYFGIERVWGSETQWFAVGEMGWYYSNEDIAKLEVLEVFEVNKGLIMIKTNIDE